MERPGGWSVEMKGLKQQNILRHLFATQLQPPAFSACLSATLVRALPRFDNGGHDEEDIKD